MSTTAPGFNSNALLDHLLAAYQLKNDAHLSRELGVAPPVISKIRHKRLPVGASLKLRAMRKFGITLAKIDELAPEAA